MNTNQLRYLREINQLLGGPIRAVIEEPMASHLASGIHNLLSRMLVQEDLGQFSGGRLARQRSLLPKLHQALLDDAQGQSQIATLEELLAREATDTTALERCRDAIAFRLTALNTDEARLALQALISEERCYWLEVDERVEAVLAAAARRVSHEVAGLSQEQQQGLLRFLRENCGESEDLAIVSVRSLPGGYSKQTIITKLANNRHLPAEIVIRRDQPESPTGTTVVDEFPLLQLLYAAGVKVPRPWAVDRGEAIGSPILVVSKSSGKNIGDPYKMFDQEGKAQCAMSLAVELAKIHNIPLEKLPDTIKGKRQTTLEYESREIEEFYGLWRDLDQPCAIIQAAFQWLLGHLHYAEGQRTLVHRDARYNNILVDEQGVTAILDWEMAMVGNPARDLSWVYQHVVQIADWDEFLSAYQEAGGAPPPEEQINFYLVWVELYTLIHLLRAQRVFLSGATDNIHMAFGGESLREPSMYVVADRLQKALAWELQKNADAGGLAEI